MQQVYSCDEMCICFHFKVGILILQFLSNELMKLDETIGYCWCPIVMYNEVIAMIQG